VGASQIAKEFGLFAKTDKQSVGEALLPMRCAVASCFGFYLKTTCSLDRFILKKLRR
jgi:hypothetical protein